MANYVAHYTKKQQALARRVEELRRRIARGEPAERLLAAAEEVRQARLRALRARRATIPPAEVPSRGRFIPIDEGIAEVSSSDAVTVLAEFGGRPGP
jgi:hypothetical protein